MQESDDEENEITRYTLYGYVGVHFKKLNIEERQKSALEKMSFLTPLQFDCLIKDVKNEISRRTTKRPISDGDNARLCNLAEPKFKELVIDLFFVFNKKFPSKKYDNTTEADVMIYNFENLIHSLKNESEDILVNIKKQDSIFVQIKIYQQYLKRLFKKENKNTLVIEYMDNVFDLHDVFLLDILNNPEYLISIADKKLCNNDYYREIRSEYTSNTNKDKKTQYSEYVLKVIELLLLDDTYCNETSETIYLLRNYKISDVEYNKRLKKLVSNICARACKLGLDDKVKQLKSLRVPVQKDERGATICFLAEILKSMMIKDQNV